ncbi:MAG: hypothetical protein AAF651_02765 [Cyanobacteria bacterium P01_C01_bin.73]
MTSSSDKSTWATALPHRGYGTIDLINTKDRRIDSKATIEERLGPVEDRLERSKALIEPLAAYQTQSFQGLNGLLQIFKQTTSNLSQLTERVNPLTEGLIN